MSDIDLCKEQICDVCHKMWQLGWVAANDGNVSAMLDDGTILATPTGMSKSFITPEKLIRIDRQGNVLEAAPGLRPSSEIKMHLRCYDKRPDVKSVIHAHPPGATGFAVASCGKVDSLAFDTWGVDYGMITSNDYLMSLPTNYRDPRTYGVPEQLFRKIAPEKLYHATGNQIMPINTLFQLMTEKGKRLESACMLFMPDLFAWALCGSHTVDRTIASTSQMVNPLTGNWDHGITALTPFSAAFFPKIVDCATVCGEHKGIPVVKVWAILCCR